jgi:Zn-dependent protease
VPYNEQYDPGTIIIWFVVFLLSLTVHEWCMPGLPSASGDATGRYLGRVTLNPIPHIDLFWDDHLPPYRDYDRRMDVWLGETSAIQSTHLRDRRSGEIVIALAGPMSNFLLVGIFIVAHKRSFQSSLLPSEALGTLTEPIGTYGQYRSPSISSLGSSI